MTKYVIIFGNCICINTWLFFSPGDPLANDDEEEGIEQENSEKIQALSENEKPHVLKWQCDRYYL